MDSKQAAREQLSQARTSLLDLSHRIHAHPELGFEEEQACGWLAEMLDAAGFKVQTRICDLPTAFIAKAGNGPLNVGIMAEYDSLPGVGHACGHNLIAAMSTGAAMALAKVADDAGITVTVIGTPAEEVGNAGGKVLLLERGAFDGLHAAMMVHPAPMDFVQPKIIAASMFDVHYTGKEAHASAYPELGINAADALTVAQTSIGLLRQHIRQSDRIHGICTHGGEAPNIVPAHTSARYIIRGETVKDMEELRVKVRHCFEAGALATGSKLEIRGGDKPYTEMLHDADMAELYRRNAVTLGRGLAAPESVARFSASTDMGNVSQALPSIHPMIGIDCLPAVNHQPEFTAHCVSAAADQALWDGALGMAWTAIDMAADKSLSARLLARK
ncbi:MAG TPA: M20 family metallopeptidase [Gammaproteobacteria bacterium]|nr:M20 family metallopeptidase [Gammaproteobacteria bacterium]